MKLEKTLQEKDKKIKVYLAILNRGWIRREIHQKTIPVFKQTPGIEIIEEDMSKTWDNVIGSNRNKIVLRFLKTDCDFLKMIDHDIIPQDNSMAFVYADKRYYQFSSKSQAGRSVFELGRLRKTSRQRILRSYRF